MTLQASRRASSKTDPALRSLLQKAVRRGYVGTVQEVVNRLAERGDSAWLRARATIIAFEECWPCVAQVAQQGKYDPLKMLLAVTQSVKQKNAAGLGSLAFAYSEGDKSAALSALQPQAVRIVAAAHARPVDFFKWADRQSVTQEQKNVVDTARHSLAGATWGWDKTCILSGAYLACVFGVPSTESAVAVEDKDFPYWVALDKHTPQGKKILQFVANELDVSLQQMQWVSFYFESAVTNKLETSMWWESERSWRLGTVGLSLRDAQKIWRKALEKIRVRSANEAELLKASVKPRYEGAF